MSYSRVDRKQPIRLVQWILIVISLGVFVSLIQSVNRTSQAARANADTTSYSKDDRLLRPSDYGRVPLSFEVNQGQTDGAVQYLSRGSGYTIFLTPSQAVLSLQQRVGTKSLNHVLRMAMVGSDPAAKVAGVDQLPGKSNYFIGNDPRHWRVGVPTFAKVAYEGVYRGINLIYYGNQRQLENDFIVTPGANPSAIKLTFHGAKNISTDDAGNLQLANDNGTVILQKPDLYQVVNGTRRTVFGNYHVNDRQDVGFEIGEYDHAVELVIDPVVIFSSSLLD